MGILKKSLVFGSERDEGARSKIGKIGISARHPNLETTTASASPPLLPVLRFYGVLSRPVGRRHIGTMINSSPDVLGKNGALADPLERYAMCIQCRFPFSV